MNRANKNSVNKNSSGQTKFRLRPFSRGLLKRFQLLQSRQIISAAGWGALASIPGLAFAGPTGESVAGGAVDVLRPNVNRTEINQTSQNAIVNWNSFSIDGDEFVLIQQPNSSSTILNRVIGSQQSQILGQLQANGRVFLVNPQGVYVAPGASLDVGAITLSALDINNEDFMAGNYVFTGDPNQVAGIENAGTITTSNGGYAVLAGDYVNNSGVITATLGTVVLAAGEQVTLDIDNDGLVGFAVDEATVASLAGVENTGAIIADGGRVVMTASVANDLVATAVNNQGLVRAHRIEEQGGEIYLTGYGGDVTHGGTIDVAGDNGNDGGNVIVYGDQDVTLETGSRIIATGSGAGGGGTVRVIADGMLDFKKDAEIDADGAGFVELSGHSGIAIRGVVNVGQGGDLLIDPSVLTIRNDGASPSVGSSSESSGSYGGSCPTSACVGKGFIENQLTGGTNVTLIADQEIRSSGGPFTINATSSEGGSGDLALKIGTVIDASFNCSTFGVCGAAPNTLGTDPTGNINLSDVSINILGDFSASAGTVTGNVNLGSINAANVHVTAGSTAGNINIAQASAAVAGSPMVVMAAAGGGLGIAAASTDLSLQAPGGNINVNGNLSLTGFSFTDIDVKANTTSGQLNINGNVSTVAFAGDGGGDANVSLEAGNINVAGGVTAIGTSSAEINGSANNNITIAGSTVARSANGEARIVLDANGTITVGALTAEGTSGSVSLSGNNISTKGNVNVVGTSAAYFGAFAANNLAINNLVTVSEAGGGFANAVFGADNGLALINGAIIVNAGPGGVANVSFGEAEGSAINNLLINRQVIANGALGDGILVNVKNSALTASPGLLQAGMVQVNTHGVLPNIDITTNAQQIVFNVQGGAPNVAVNNALFGGPTSFLMNGGTFRSGKFLTNSNINFFGGFQADNLLVGAPNGVVNFQGPVFITGATPFAPTAPDLELFRIMLRRGLPPPGHGPSVQILGGNGINMANPFVLGGANPFIKMFSNRGFNTPGLTTNAASVLAVFNPISLAAPIVFGDTPRIPPFGALGFFNSVNIEGLPDNSRTTVVIGEKGLALPFLSGPVNIGPDAIDLGNRNMFIISRGAVRGDELVRTNGIFEIIGLAATNIFQTPVVNEFEDRQNDDEDDDELPITSSDNSDGGDEGTISEESNSESMECAA